MCPRLDSNQHVLTNTTPSRWQVYQFLHVGRVTKIKKVKQMLNLSDPAGARTQDPNIKSVVLYQLSYRVNKKIIAFLKGSVRIKCDPAGARTQDPNIKSVVLYQLSYRVKSVSLNAGANIISNIYFSR